MTEKNNLTRNAILWEIDSRIIGLKTGVPATSFADHSFDRVYCTTTLEMIRGMMGENGYKECLTEIYQYLGKKAVLPFSLNGKISFSDQVQDVLLYALERF